MPQQASSVMTARVDSYVENADGTVSVVFDGGIGFDFPSKNALWAFILSLNADPDTPKKLALAWWAARSPDLNNTNLIVGKTLTFDISSPNPIRVQ